ncbi:hypothetical protein K3163_02120 [Qipengyuania sp. 1NDW9]|uniref:hypothetical protein n=1 Tax=Qipengyuania xiapuensis TaxID=2867236 RepID=UPI001C86E4EE|nr:hypothetical protein [Qipengyuania xiapuensis]MBX7492001.1 hypothetical protein [Qipengyuania xiapuensis]
MFSWLKNGLSRPHPLENWSVEIAEDHITTSDGQGEVHQLPLADLEEVVIATDDSGPWGADVVYLLYSMEKEPVGLFPIEAQGTQEFVEWLSQRDGYNDQQLRNAMRSTQIARFLIYQRPTSRG